MRYKKRGGTYSNKVPKNKTSLNKWTKEQWQYINADSKRYLPKKVIDSLTLSEKKEATISKKTFGKNYKYQGACTVVSVVSLWVRVKYKKGTLLDFSCCCTSASGSDLFFERDDLVRLPLTIFFLPFYLN